MSRVRDAVNETFTALGTVMRNPALRNINLAWAGSAIGDWAYATAIMVWAYGVGGVALVGIWGTVRYVLLAIVSPFAATLADRYPRQRVMVASDLVRMVLVLAAAGLIAANGPVLVVLTIATLANLAGSPFRPAMAALMPNVVERPQELTAANGVVSTIESLAFFVGPALGGVLLTFTSVPVVAVFNALTFLWSALLVSRVNTHLTRKAADTAAQEAAAAAASSSSTNADVDGGEQPSGGAPVATVAQEAEEETGGFLNESMEGFRAIWANSDLRLIALIYTA